MPASNHTASRPRRRFLALWLPFLTADRWRHADSSPTDYPIAFVDPHDEGARLAALSPAAVAAGLAPGQDLASARAAVPELIVHDQDPDADRGWLERIADACDRFTPLHALDAPDGIVLDITEASPRWGGEVALVAAVEARFAQPDFALQIRTATAASPEGAAALTRFATDPGQTSLHALPVAALRLDDAVENALRRAGLATVGDLARRPAEAVAARFGMATAYALDRLLGRVDSRLTPRRPPPALLIERRLAAPIAHLDTTMAVLAELVAEASAELERRGRGGRRFTARCYCSDQASFDLAVETGEPTRDAPALMQLFRAQVEALGHGGDVDMIRLSVPMLEPLAAAQLSLKGGEAAAAECAARAAQPTARPRRVRRGANPIPEQAAFAFPASCTPAPAARPPSEPLRPLHLFDPPQPIEVTAAGLPDGPPTTFRWRRAEHRVTRHEGPERIASEWRRPDRSADDAPRPTRDYYRIEDARGRGYWIFRNGRHGDGANDARWYVHGLFA